MFNLNDYQYIINIARQNHVENIAFHAITDGRDTSPISGLNFISQLEEYINNDVGYRIATICGRYYAMDRDNRWDRIEKAYRLYILGEGEKYKNSSLAIKTSYKNKVTDEFIPE